MFLIYCYVSVYLQIERRMSEDLEKLVRKVKYSVESRDFYFVEPFPGEVQTECSICLQILKEPYVVGCCGYRFCKACLNPMVTSCPLCKALHFQKLPDKQLERLLSQKDIYCLLHDSGCKWTGKLCNLLAHLSFDDASLQPACDYLPVPCPYCKHHFLRMDLSKHQDSCESRPYNCMHCSHTCVFKDLIKHYEVCSKYPHPCRNRCGKHFTKGEMESHMENDCPLEVVRCEYHFAGCEEPFLRKDLDEHLEEQVKLHLQLMKMTCRQLQDEASGKASSSDVQQLQEENRELYVMIVDLTARIDELVLENKELKEKTDGEIKEIQHLKITNLPPAVTKHNLHCVFGQFGTVKEIKLNNPHNAFIKYASQRQYEDALLASSKRGLNLLKHRLRLEEMYS